MNQHRRSLFGLTGTAVAMTAVVLGVGCRSLQVESGLAQPTAGAPTALPTAPAAAPAEAGSPPRAWRQAGGEPLGGRTGVPSLLQRRHTGATGLHYAGIVDRVRGGR